MARMKIYSDDYRAIRIHTESYKLLRKICETEKRQIVDVVDKAIEIYIEGVKNEKEKAEK